MDYRNKKTLLAVLILLTTALGPLVVHKYLTNGPSYQQYANFSQTDLAQIRWITFKACTIHTDPNMIADYIRNESFFTFGSSWNVFVYSIGDAYHLYSTAFYKKESQKRFYFAMDMPNYQEGIYLVEEGKFSSQLSQPFSKKALDDSFRSEIVTYPSKVSREVTVKQLQAINYGVQQVYQRTNDCQKFSKALQELIADRIGQIWDVCAVQSSIPRFGVAYTSPYNQWIEFKQKIQDINGLYIYVWRNSD